MIFMWMITGRAPQSQTIAKLSGSKIVALSAGTSYSFALTDQGNVFTWGSNTFGELGTGNKNETLLPTKVIIPEPVTQIAAGPRGLAMAKSGTLYAWSTNQYGEVGDGANEERLSPVKVEIPKKVVKIFRSSTKSYI